MTNFFSLIVLGLLLVLYLWHAFSIVYHFIRFGIGTQPKNMALIFLAGSVILFSITVFAYSQIDWQNIFPFNTDSFSPIQNATP